MDPLSKIRPDCLLQYDSDDGVLICRLCKHVVTPSATKIRSHYMNATKHKDQGRTKAKEFKPVQEAVTKMIDQGYHLVINLKDLPKPPCGSERRPKLELYEGWICNRCSEVEDGPGFAVQVQHAMMARRTTVRVLESETSPPRNQAHRKLHQDRGEVYSWSKAWVQVSNVYVHIANR
jgi:hypothetical protein